MSGSLRSRLPWHIGLFTASITWGATYPILDYIVTLPPQTGLTGTDYLVARFALSSLLLLPLLLFRWQETKRVLRAIPIRVGIMGVASIALYNSLQLHGQTEVNPSVAAIVVALEPLLAFLMAWTAGLERPDRWKIGGLGLALAGLALLAAVGALGKAGAQPSLVPLLCILFSPICWAIATVLGKPASDKYDPLVVAAVSMVIGTAPLLPLPWLGDGTGLRSLAGQPSEFYWALGFMVVFPTVLSVLLWYAALRRLSVMALSAYMFLTPVHGVLLSSLYREFPGLGVIVGGLVVLAGVIVCSMSPPDSSQTPLEEAKSSKCA